ncbi:hypothetical protein DPX16_15141 [Anabarilius grahami]|uniref:Uncharacterized protein n=1 Tax=Anabarilius grahami TaxID=495550 RepID=A0A3N0YVT8_ANAGA|nr:hypothetical protein DPX16_15141 [Anabarilius grahami]
MARRFSISLRDLPQITNVYTIVENHSQTKVSKFEKGYKFFYENYIFNYEVSDVVDSEVIIRAQCYRSMRKNEEPHSLQGIHPEAVDRLLVRKPKTSNRSGIKSTLYRAYTGPLPNNLLLSSVESLISVRPQPLICKVLHGLSELNLMESKFGLVPKDVEVDTDDDDEDEGLRIGDEDDEDNSIPVIVNEWAWRKCPCLKVQVV